jgi:drug/metabolite transporter (DMT)-like permease
VLCAIASVVGVIITTLGAEGMKSSVLGVIMLMIAVFAGALFYVFSKKSGEYFNPLERTYVMFGVGSFVYICIALIECAGNYREMIVDALAMPQFWGCIVYLAVASSVIAFMVLNYGSSHVSVSEASLFANLTTVISILAGVLVLHETFTLQQIIGAIIIIASVYISSVEPRKEKICAE